MMLTILMMVMMMMIMMMMMMSSCRMPIFSRDIYFQWRNYYRSVILAAKRKKGRLSLVESTGAFL